MMPTFLAFVANQELGFHHISVSGCLCGLFSLHLLERFGVFQFVQSTTALHECESFQKLQATLFVLHGLTIGSSNIFIALNASSTTIAIKMMDIGPCGCRSPSRSSPPLFHVRSHSKPCFMQGATECIGLQGSLTMPGFLTIGKMRRDNLRDIPESTIVTRLLMRHKTLTVVGAGILSHVVVHASIQFHGAFQGSSTW